MKTPTNNFTEKIINFWNGWQVRGMVLLSLFSQIILIIFGSKRKYIAKSWIQILVWSTYLGADWVATFALGHLVISQTNRMKASQNNTNYILQAFWAPFLLLHLGGPDTITAFSLEDNDLWLRHLLGLLVQVGVALNIFWRFLSNRGALAYVAIPMFVAGIVKYGDRTWVLRSSSANNFRESLRATTEFGRSSSQSDANSPTDLFCEADYLFNRFKYIFTELSLPVNEIKNCLSIIRKKKAEDAFKLVEIELGFMYDKLYTKATSTFSKFGIYLRCISSISTICALVAFVVVIDKHPYPIIDVIITYLLLVGAICLEFYAFIMLILSDRTSVLVAKQKLPHWIPHCSQQNLIKRRRWWGSMPQLSLMDIILKAKMNKWVQKSLGIIEELQISRLSKGTDVSADVQKLIFTAIVEKSEILVRSNFDGDMLRRLFNLERSSDDHFDRRLIVQHIATELLYHDELSRCGGNVDELDPKCKASKCLSDYLLYLLVMRPSMLPKGGRDIWYRETCATMAKYFEGNEKIFRNTSSSEACKVLLEEESQQLELIEKRENKENSVLTAGFSVAKELMQLTDNKWEILSERWVNLLIFAVGECGWKEHGQQLRKGGDLLSHVSLLMAHFGLSQQYFQAYRPLTKQLGEQLV